MKIDMTNLSCLGLGWGRVPRKALQFTGLALALCAATVSAQEGGKKPNVLIIWGDDIGTENISYYNRGMMGYQTPNIDRIAKEGIFFTTASRAARRAAPRSSAGRCRCAAG